MLCRFGQQVHSDILAVFGRCRLQDQALAVLRGHVEDIVTGTLFVFIGLAACAIAAIRRRSGVRLLLLVGLWSAMYGARPLVDSLAALNILPHRVQSSAPYMGTLTGYLLLVVALLAFRELTLGKLRFFVQVVITVGLVIAASGIGYFVFTGSKDKLMPYNNLLAACSLSVLLTVVVSRKLSQKFLVLPDRGVLAVGTLLFAIQALYGNLLGALGHGTPQIWGSLGFAALLFSLGYVALQMVVTSERRLLAIENELAIAREIQASILPKSVPTLENLRIGAAYHPMAAVAGDFYEFIPVDAYRAGFLIADVTGHGVPAALIASMIKVAVQTVVPCAQDPREVLCGLNRILSSQFRDQFVTAAYLWLDTQEGKALYSAAGHPPLLRWRNGSLERIESNGLLLGVLPESDYPVLEMAICPGDRFLLYTDGVVEPENERGDCFGDHNLEQVVRNNESRAPSEFSDALLSEIRRWQPTSVPQQDDITIIVIDVV